MEKVNKDDAIVTDVSDEQEVELSPRDLIMNQAVRGRQKELIEEIVEAGGEVDFEIEQEKVALSDTVQTDDEAGTETETILDDASDTHDVKISGEDRTVSSEEINEKLGTEGDITDAKVAEYQKHVTGDIRLEQAATQKKANDDRAEDLAKKELELEALKVTPAGGKPKEITDDMVTQFMDGVLLENPEKVREILEEIRGPGVPAAQQQTITKEDLHNAALGAVATLNYNEDLVEGQKAAKEAFPHLHDGDVLQGSLDSEAAKIYEGDKTKPASQILMEAAENVQAKILKAAGGEEKKSQTEITNNKKRAASQHSAPKGGGAVAPATPSDKEPQTRQQVTADIVNSRNTKLAGQRPAF